MVGLQTFQLTSYNLCEPIDSLIATKQDYLSRPTDLWWSRVIDCPMISKYGLSLSKAVGPVNPSFLLVVKNLTLKNIHLTASLRTP